MATYTFTDNGAFLTMTRNTASMELKKDYITVFSSGTIVYLRYQDRENKNARYSYDIPYTDITSPAFTDADDARDQILAWLVPTGGGGSPSYTDANFGTFGASLGAAVPNDTDVVITVDSTTAKKITWANVKAFLKAYFDTIYTTSAAVATQISTALSGYLTSAAAASAYQPLDSDLTSIAALTPSNDDIIQRKAGAWTNRSLAQLKTDLALTSALIIPTITGAAVSMTDGATYYWGSSGAVGALTTQGNARIYNNTGKTITIVAVSTMIRWTVGSSEAASVYLRYNNTTDYLISNAVAGDVQIANFVVSGLSIAWADGDYVEMKMVNPTWVTNPSAMSAGGQIHCLSPVS